MNYVTTHSPLDGSHFLICFEHDSEEFSNVPSYDHDIVCIAQLKNSEIIWHRKLSKFPGHSRDQDEQIKKDILTYYADSKAGDKASYDKAIFDAGFPCILNGTEITGGWSE